MYLLLVHSKYMVVGHLTVRYRLRCLGVSSFSPYDTARCHMRKNFPACFCGTYQIVPEGSAIFWPHFAVLVESLHLINSAVSLQSS